MHAMGGWRYRVYKYQRNVSTVGDIEVQPSRVVYVHLGMDTIGGTVKVREYFILYDHSCLAMCTTST